MPARAAALAVLLCLLGGSVVLAQRWDLETGEAQWIWSADHPKDEVPVGTCYFRKTFTLARPGEGQVDIACQDKYELYVNGRRAGRGDAWQVLDTFDISRLLVAGRNVIAVKAENLEAGAAGLVARVTVRSAGSTYVSHSTDASWLASSETHRRWNWAGFDDSGWKPARSYGEFGRTPPWNDFVRPADGTSGARFELPRDFHIERVVAPDKTGSVAAFTFDEWGNLLVAREGAEVVLVEDLNRDGIPESPVVLNRQVKGCQGLLAVNGEVYAVGEGPQGIGLYHLTDGDGDGQPEGATRLVAFKGTMNEHGPHAPVLGPDGMIYIVLGNHIELEAETADTSPYRYYYEGDLNRPRQEDAGGHAHGIKAPGGMIVRVTLDGRKLEAFAGGLRNAYDIAFNADGELFTYDSDMEWDEGLPWYRPTRVLHVPPGAEFGWRSGWAKWPNYFVDNLPPIVETGRGSPAGITFYNHQNFPRAYQGAMFACDWSRGRVLAVKLQRHGGTYRATSEVFLQGKPLNVTDIAVGPDGWLYFATGGRGTEGGIYRVVYDGVPPRISPGSGVRKATAQPQFYSAFAREQLALVQEQLGAAWDQDLIDLIADANADPQERVQGMGLMHLYGPYPTPDQLVAWSQDASPQVRARATYLMGLHRGAGIAERLAALLNDEDAAVRRLACESLARAGHAGPLEKLVPLLGDKDRFVAWAARGALQRVPPEQWKQAVLETKVPAIFNRGAAALLAMKTDKQTAVDVIATARRVMRGFVGDDDFIDLLRVMQIALDRGGLEHEDVPELRPQLAVEYPAATDVNPAGGYRINRELMRLLAHLQASEALPRMVAQLQSDILPAEKLHVACYAPFIRSGWTGEQKFAFLEYYEAARVIDGGYSLSRYVENVARDFAKTLTEPQEREVLDRAVRWPTTALGVLVKLPQQPDEAILTRLEEIDRELASVEGEAARRMQTGIAAVLARAGDPQSMAYLREVFEKFPSRRHTVAMALAQRPGGANWPLIVRSLPVLEDAAAVEVLKKLATVDLRPTDPEPVRQVILAGLRLGDDGSEHAVALLEHWFGERLTGPEATWEAALGAWQERFRRTFPDEPPPVLPATSRNNKWSMDELLKYLDAPENAGDPARGSVVFTKAQCAKCHRFGRRGEGAGPDLTTVSRRFQRKEVIESVLFPSHVVSDQYRSKTVVTVQGLQYTGIVGAGGADDVVILQSSGQKIRVANRDVDEIVPHPKSAMPEGLFNPLTLEEIADLFAFLYQESEERLTRRIGASR